MKKPFNVAPRCVQWAAVILIAVQIFSTVVAFNVTSVARLLPFGGVLLGTAALQLAFAVGLLFGINLVRLLFTATHLYSVVTLVIHWSEQGFSSRSMVSDLTVFFAPCISVVLVFLPAAELYFSGKPQSEPVVEKIEQGKAWTFGSIWQLAVLLLLLGVGIPLVRHFRPAFESATAMSKAQKIAYAKYQEDLQDLVIVENLRMLGQAQGQYFMGNSATTASYSDLVGPDRLIRKLTTSAAGETYPDEYVSGKEPVATLPDGRIVFFDMEAFKAKRVLPR